MEGQERAVLAIGCITSLLLPAEFIISYGKKGTNKHAEVLQMEFLRFFGHFSLPT